MEQPKQVTVVFDQEGQVVVVPYVVHIHPTNQSIQWNLVSQVPGVVWDDLVGGITFEAEPPAPYQPWPGGPATPCPGKPEWYCADAGRPNEGTVPVKYMYWINLLVPVSRNGQTEMVQVRVSPMEKRALSPIVRAFDPDISNDPPRP